MPTYISAFRAVDGVTDSATLNGSNVVLLVLDNLGNQSLLFQNQN